MDSSISESLLPNLEFFRSIPWCQKVISEEGWTAVPTRCRTPKSSTEDSLFAETLQTPDTIPQHLSLVLAPAIPLPESYTPSTALPIPAIRTLWCLGIGLNGFPGIAHGGLLSALLDEQMGMLLTVNSEYASARASPDITEMTVYMNVRYRAPVNTPGVILVDARVEKREGRKTWLRSTIIDAKGVECASAESLFVDVPASRM
jgi:acyl-coenzyme A thioesterase THEM4